MPSVATLTRKQSLVITNQIFKTKLKISANFTKIYLYRVIARNRTYLRQLVLCV